MQLNRKKETAAMTASVLSSAFLVAAMSSSAVTVGILGGMALWCTSFVSAGLTGIWARQNRKKLADQNGQPEAYEQEQAARFEILHDVFGFVSDLMLIDMLDGSPGLIMTMMALAAATSPVSMPAYAVYQRFKAMPEKEPVSEVQLKLEL